MKQSAPLQAHAPGKGSVWRPLGANEHLPDLPPSSADGLVMLLAEYGQVLGGGPVPGELRCSAIGLHAGDCSQRHIDGSRYCAYHEKVRTGIITSFLVTNSAGTYVDTERVGEGASWQEVSPSSIYPVWPLPEKGYVLLDREVELAA